MGRKLSDRFYDEGDGVLVFFCPGCSELHAVHTRRPNSMGATWAWNQSYDKPTFHPSLLVRYKQEIYCHSWIRDGKIDFLPDSQHALAGQTVDIPVLPRWVGEDEE